MLRSIAILALVVLALFLFAQFVRRTSMFFPERYPLGDWDTSSFAIRPAEQTFTTSDGTRLHGWIFRARAARAPLMIWFHGNAGNITSRAAIAQELAQRGVSVLLFDWRGYGRSSGSPAESALYDDSISVYDYARNAMHNAPQDIVLYGESLGGPYAAWVAKQRGARCVVVESSFPSLKALGNALYEPIPLGWFAPFAMQTADWLNDARVPTLVMHGKRDEVIPFRLGVALYERLRVPKDLFISDSSGHCEIAAVEGSRYYDTVTSFIGRAK